jgi:superfamily II DNA or RNA helicase
VDALQEWRRRGRRGIAHVVTGAGKTRFAELCISDFLSAYPDGRAVVLVPTLALLDQWYLDLREDLGVQDEELGLFSGEGRPSDPRRINLVVLNSGREVAPALSKGAETLLIVDECHRAGAPHNALALRGEHRATLGLSATPEREYDEGLQQVLVPRLGEIFFTYDYADARRDGVITDFSLVNVAVPLSGQEASRYDALSGRVARAARAVEAGREDETKLRRALRARAGVAAAARMRIPVAVRIADLNRGRRIVIFHERIDAAEEIYTLLKERGHNVTLYHSRIGEAIRRDNLRLFRSGVFQVLVSCRALDEGMNVPETEVGVIASSTASIRQRIQRLGRVLRPAPGKQQAVVYTLYATEVEEKRLRREAEALTAASEVRWQTVEVPGA